MPSIMAATAAAAHGLQHDAEEAGGASEVAPPQRVAGISGQRRIEHARDLRPACSQRASAERRSPGAARRRTPQRAQAAQGEVAIVGRGAVADAVAGQLDGRYSSASRTTITPSIASEWPTMYFVAGMDDDVDAVRGAA